MIFTSDNGGQSDERGITSNHPLRSGKGYPYEGGIRVPFIASWPGTIPAGRVSYEPVITTDLFRTLVEVAGLAPPEGHPSDGISLLAHLLSGAEQSLEERDLIWHFPHYRQGRRVTPYSIIRSGNKKLIRWWEGPDHELYDLFVDQGETNDLSAARPDLVRELDRKLLEMLDEAGARLPKENPDHAGR